jgi:magnesium transporter
VCGRWIDETPSGDAIHALARLSDDARSSLLALLGPESAAAALDLMPDLHAVDAIEDLTPSVAANIVEELSSDERADLLKRVGEEQVEAILSEVDREVAEDIRKLVAYDDDSAGSIMLTEYLARSRSHGHGSRELLADIESKRREAYADYNIQYTYVVDDEEGLVGVLPLRNVLLARRVDSPVREVMIPDPDRRTGLRVA